MKTHEVNLSTTAFNQFTKNDYIILQANEIKQNDYVLFKQIETVNEEIKETGLYRMTQVKEIVENDGLKDGYVLLILQKL